MIKGADCFFIVHEIISGVIVNTQKIIIGILVDRIQRVPGFSIINIISDRCQTCFFIQVTIFCENAFTQFKIIETAARSFIIAIAADYSFYPFCSNVIGIIFHFNQDKLAVAAI